MGGYLICKMPKEEVEKNIKNIKIWYDEGLSQALKLSIFWTDAEIKKETALLVKGKFFTIDEVIIFGIKYASEFTDLSQIKG